MSEQSEYSSAHQQVFLFLSKKEGGRRGQVGEEAELGRRLLEEKWGNDH